MIKTINQKIVEKSVITILNARLSVESQIDTPRDPKTQAATYTPVIPKALRQCAIFPFCADSSLVTPSTASEIQIEERGA